MHSDQDGVVPGNALVVDPKKQFRPLSKFGNAFLNRFQCSSTKSDVLKGISIGKEHALKKYDQFAPNTSCFCGSIGSKITPVVQFHEFFVTKVMN